MVPTHQKEGHMEFTLANPFRAFIDALQHDLLHHERAAEDIRQQIVEAEEDGAQWETLKDEAE